MASREHFESVVGNAPRADQRFALLGALLAKETGLGGRLVIVGGSAITIYTDGLYVSGDVDLVGGKARIEPALRKWGFEHDGRYWRRDEMGLVVELGREDYAGLWAGTTLFSTSEGPVRLAAPEDLIVRRLIYATGEFGEKSRRAVDEAVLLYRLLGPRLDFAYLEREVLQERVREAFTEMLRRSSTGRQPPRGTHTSRRTK